MNLLGEQRRSGKIFTGEWTAPDGDDSCRGTGTGIDIGRVGQASLATWSDRWLGRHEAQTTWAAVSLTERAAVMRRAADLGTVRPRPAHRSRKNVFGGG
jgi:acyl-CoA reductase-like NAD-dependent aldehyde dehydrogenase